MAIKTTLQSFTQLPSPLQALFFFGSVVFTVKFRKMIIGRGVSVRGLICLVAVLLGLFVAAGPETFDLPVRNMGNATKNSLGFYEDALKESFGLTQQSGDHTIILGQYNGSFNKKCIVI